MGVRKAVFAGSWYPASPKACEKEINAFLKASEQRIPEDANYLAGIVPHAGWYYSGALACNVIHGLATDAATDVVVIFGMHLHPNAPCYIMKSGAWETPFGAIDIHDGLASKLIERFSFEIEDHLVHTRDNTIELQLPFVKYFFRNAALVPIGVPPNQTSLAVGETLADIAAEMGLRIKVIGSTDLTHYGYNYGYVPHGTGSAAVDWVRNSNDRRVIDAMLAMSPEKVIDEALASQNACCAGAASTAIAAAKKLGARQAEMVAYATSYDKSPGDSFVGYVGIVFA
jgi:AmmeMemoRadiSam system protein B